MKIKAFVETFFKTYFSQTKTALRQDAKLSINFLQYEIILTPKALTLFSPIILENYSFSPGHQFLKILSINIYS